MKCSVVTQVIHGMSARLTARERDIDIIPIVLLAHIGT